MRVAIGYLFTSVIFGLVPLAVAFALAGAAQMAGVSA